MHLKLSHGDWVFVGDGQKALFLINEGDGKFPNLRRLSVLESPDPPSREQGSDAPGRAYSSVGEIHSAVEETDWHELQKERFAAQVAEQINRAAQANAFGQIVIVAPAKSSWRAARRVYEGDWKQDFGGDRQGSHPSLHRRNRAFAADAVKANRGLA
jgi:protein required for attachment to host cells